MKVLIFKCYDYVIALRLLVISLRGMFSFNTFKHVNTSKSVSCLEKRLA